MGYLQETRTWIFSEDELKAKIKEIVFEYSEWLDSEQHLVSGGTADDNRSHEDLVNQFFEERENG